jgi:hypothetical protein
MVARGKFGGGQAVALGRKSRRLATVGWRLAWRLGLAASLAASLAARPGGLAAGLAASLAADVSTFSWGHAICATATPFLLVKKLFSLRGGGS